jgi:Mrp family chromosome partitioning ATPase
LAAVVPSTDISLDVFEPPVSKVQVEKVQDKKIQQTETPPVPIPLIHVVLPTPRRRAAPVPRTPLRRRKEEILEQSEVVVATPTSEPETVIVDTTPSFLPEVEVTELRCVPFLWPTICDKMKEKAAQQIGLLADDLIAQHEQGRKTICFHSYLPSEGCSTHLLCAVRELTDRGFSVLLVDGNVHRPQLLELLDIPTTAEDGERLSLIDHRLELLSLHGLPGETNPLSLQVGSLKNSYDFILIDAGSLTEGEPSEKDLFWQETATDGVFLVVNAKNHRPVNLKAIANSLHRHGIELLGVSENHYAARPTSEN